MVRLARLLTGSPAVAEELVQDAFIKFARSAGKKDEPAAYLRVIVVNLCRSQQRRNLIERRLAPKAPVASGAADIDETWDVIRKLPFRQRAALMLRYYEDLPEADIACLLGCRPGTVKSALHRGLAALRKELGERGEERDRRQSHA
jgi:RNA polymerase sigma factor (sigma-70 family)